MSIKQSKITKFIKTLIALVIILASSLNFAKVVRATWSVESYMLTGTSLGVMPITDGTYWYFCKDRGKMLRTGTFDVKTYYADDFAIVEASGMRYMDECIESGLVPKAEKILNAQLSALQDNKGWSGDMVDNREEILSNTKYNVNKKVQIFTDGAKFEDIWQFLGERISNFILKDLDALEISKDYSDDIDADKPVEQEIKTVTVIEDKDGNRGYNESGEKTAINDANSYILNGTFFKDDVKRNWGYNEEDIQVAYWMNNDRTPYLYGPENLGLSEKAMKNGRKLYAEALAYQEWVNAGNADNYNTSMSKKDTQIFVNRRDGARNEDEYIIGPISISYPSAKTYEDATYSLPEQPHFSYIADLQITTDTGANLSYRNGDFQIYSERMGKCTGSTTYPDETVYPNTNYCPENGENFYIILNASKANYPKKLNIQANFEYVEKSEARYIDLTGDAVLYQYKKHGIDARDIGVTYKASRAWWQSIPHKHSGYTDSDGNYHSGYTTYENHSGTFTVEISFRVFQPFVNMYKEEEYKLGDLYDEKNEVDRLEAQPLIRLIYTIIGSPEEPTPPEPTSPEPTSNGSISQASTSIEIDLTMEMGGTVWVDGKSGKESALDGQYGTDSLGNPSATQGGTSDIPMSGVTVKLHQLDHTGAESIVDETKTDGKGEYLFKELNAQYQYYIEFVYNGQYYEPTKHKATNATDTNESRGLDFLSDKQSINSTYYNFEVDIEGRASFNVKFEEIASTPNNYKTKGGDYAEVFTRDYLRENGFIDEFGNPAGGAPQYVRDCLMSAFTMDDASGDKLEVKDGDKNPVQKTEDKRNIEFYPRDSRFVIDEMLNTINQKSLATDSQNVAISTYTPVYSEEYNIKEINQGYAERQESDVALSKDVYKVVQEINGKTETYKYNKREATQDADKCWTVETRIESQYYNKGYTREIYREDWIYQAEDTVITDLGGTLKDPKTELEIFVTYRVRIRNLSDSLGVRITEIVDYYDEDFTPVLERSFVGDKKENKLQDITIKSDEHYIAEDHITQKNANGSGSIYSNDAENSKNAPNEFKKLYVTGFENILLDSDDSKEMYIYLTFRVNKSGLDQSANSNGYEYIILDQNIITKEEYARGKDNVVEINGYKTYYGTHTSNNGKGDYGKAAVSPNGEYGPSNIAGIVDKNSKPGNVLYEDEVGIGLKADGTIVEENFENDTDNAPSIKILLLSEDTVRKIDGIVWEDGRTETVENSKIGNGKKEETEEGVNNVIVQLVEIVDADSTTLGRDCEYVWKEMKSGDTSSQDPVVNLYDLIKPDNVTSDGQYMFKGYIPGNYYVRFIYGTDDKTTGETENYQKYNGQDYKSTIYNPGGSSFSSENPDNNESFLSLEYLDENAETTYSYARDTMTTHTTADYKNNFLRRGDYYKSKYLEGTNTLVYPNDTQNYNGNTLIAGTRTYVNEYKDGNIEMKNGLAQELSDKTPNTFIISKTARINAEGEYDRTESDMPDGILTELSTEMGGKNTAGSNDDGYGYYRILNLSFGLQERPKAQLKATKQVRHVEVKLSNNSILFDAKGRATNVLWINHKAHKQDENNTYTENNNYDNKFMKVPEIRTSKGLIELTMDEEQMHGAQLKITYLITIANVGEVDYKDNQFYYCGVESDKQNNIAKTRPMQIVDYVGYQTVNDDKTTRNNLRYIASDNTGWTVTTAEELHRDDYKLLSDYAYEGNPDNGNMGANKYTTIVTTEFNNELVPVLVDNEATKVKDKITDLFQTDENITCNSVVAKTLVLTQTLTADDGGDDKTYNNLMEIVKVNNTVGRRMGYSVVGNQNPTEEPKEIDSDDSQQVRIMPPFGQNYIYYILGGAVAIILIAGIAITIRVTRKK